MDIYSTSMKNGRFLFFQRAKGSSLGMKKFLEFIKKHKKAIIIIAILAVVAVLVVKLVQSVKNAQNLLTGMQSSASTEEIEARDIVNSITATGTVVAVDKRTISSTVTGVKIKELNVQVGDQVQAGQILCLLDGENLEAQLADAQKMLGVSAGRSSLDVQSSNRGLNEAVEQRNISATRAEEDKNTAYSHVQSAASETEEAKSKYDASIETKNQAKNALDEAQINLENAKNADVRVLTAEENVAAVAPYMEALERFGNYLANEPGVSGDWQQYLNPIANEAGMYSCGINSVSVSMIYNDDNADTIAKINSSLSELSGCWQQYESACNAGSQSKIGAIEAARAAVTQAQVNYDAAVTQEDSLKQMYEAKVKSVESMWESFNNVVRAGDDTKRNNDSMVAARVDAVKNSQLSSSVATLSDERSIKQLQEQIDGCVVTASIGGIVTDVNVLQDDMYVGGPIVTIENTTDYEVSAQIDEYDIAKVKVGQEVIVKTNGTGLTEMKGEVKSIAPHATQSAMGSSGVKYEVIISILETNADLRLDMTAKVEILMEKRENVLSVSSEAIQYDEEDNAFVEVLDSGRPVDTSSLLTNPDSVDQGELEKMQNGEKSYESHKVYVTVGIVGDYYTEISADELSEGVEIVIPNDGAFSDLEAYMEEAGMIGGF